MAVHGNLRIVIQRCSWQQ